MQQPSRVFLGSVMGTVVIFALILTVQAAPDLRQKPDVLLQPEATLELTSPTFEILPEAFFTSLATMDGSGVWTPCAWRNHYIPTDAPYNIQDPNPNAPNRFYARHNNFSCY